jgi:AraC-like DNA-binding protein
MAYLQSVRLGRAHEALRRPPGSPSPRWLTGAGFAHLGRFATAYRARYGVSPSETLRHAL